MAHGIKSQVIIENSIRDGKPFRASALSGGNFHGYGRLPDPYLSLLKAGIEQGADLYMVYSYYTPIAWRAKKGAFKWVIPDVGYSATTSSHQALIKRIISYLS